MKTIYVPIIKTFVVVFISFLFQVLATPVISAQDTYSQKIKVKGGALAAGITATSDGGNVLLFNGALATIEQYPDRISVRKVSASGRKVWQKGLRPAKEPDTFFAGRGIAELSDGGYILAGDERRVIPHLDTVAESWLVKLTPEGQIDWQKRFIENNFGSIFSSVVASPDGGFFAAGKRASEFTESTESGDVGVIVASFNSGGTMRWGKTFSDNVFVNLYFVFFDFPTLLMTTDKALILVTPLSAFTSKEAGTLVLKLDADGNLLWEKLFKKNRVTSSSVTSDGGCILLFSAGAVRLSSNGDIQWAQSFHVDSEIGIGSAVTQSLDGGFVIAGSTPKERFLAKLDSAGTLISGTISKAGETEFPQFLLQAIDSGYVLFGGSDKNSFLLKLNSNANLTGCTLFSVAPITSGKFGKLKTSNPGITINDWIPQEASPDIQSKKSKSTISKLCP